MKEFFISSLKEREEYPGVVAVAVAVAVVIVAVAVASGSSSSGGRRKMQYLSLIF